MISHKYQCIFIHIPKCAGTSIESALGHFDNYTGKGGRDHRAIRMIEQPYLTPKAIFSKNNIIEVIRRLKNQYFRKEQNLKNNYSVTKEQYKSYFKFTIIRNPWARAFSWYKAVMRDDIAKKNLGIIGHVSLAEALGIHAGKGLLKPQTYWLKSFNGYIDLNYIGRFENLETDFQEICKRSNIPNIQLPHKGKGTGEDYRNFYDEASKSIISSIYKEEIALFKYTY